MGYDNIYDLKYMIEIKVTDRVMIGSESLYVLKEGEEPQFLFKTKEPQKDSGDIKVTWNNKTRGRNPDVMCIRLSSVISQIVHKLPLDLETGKMVSKYSQAVIDDLRNILFLDPEPSAMRGYARINDAELKVNASNLSAVLYKLCKNNIIKEKLLGIMRELPENEITDISFSEGPLNDVILFLKESYGKRTERIDATRLSDGTLRCLAVMAALFSEQENGMLVIEEVDNGIHPGRARKIIQAISEIASERRLDVMITTHNAVMLNALSKEDLSGVDVVYRDEDSGASSFIPLVCIHRMPQLLASGKLGDVVTSSLILEFIKNPEPRVDYSWLEE